MQYIKGIHFTIHEIEERRTGTANRLLDELLETGVSLERSEGNIGQTLMSFDVEKLDEIATDDVEMIELIDRLQNGKTNHCSYCDAITLNYYPYSFRNKNGIIKRTYECFDCAGLKLSDVETVASIRVDKGQREANAYLNGILEIGIKQNS